VQDVDDGIVKHRIHSIVIRTACYVKELQLCEERPRYSGELQMINYWKKMVCPGEGGGCKPQFTAQS
jgi:hypothetical protein